MPKFESISDVMEDVYSRFDYDLIVAFELYYRGESETREDELFESEADFKTYDAWYNNVLSKQDRQTFDKWRVHYDKKLGPNPAD